MGFEGSSLWRLRQEVGSELVLWPGATVCVIGADARVLLGQRSDDGTWAMPGGGAEEGSSFASPPEPLLGSTRLGLDLHRAWRASGRFQAR
jgi:8-oxo-dGTP pyrophosphatase MutT (NUDIX family)